MCVCVRCTKHESLPSPHAAVNHSFLQGIRAVSTPLSSLLHALPPCVLMRGPGKCLELCEEGRMGGWKKEGFVRLMPQGLGLGSSASWEKMVGKRSIALPSFIHLWIHTFVFIRLTCFSDYRAFVLLFILTVCCLSEKTHLLLMPEVINVIKFIAEQQSAFCSFYSID